jgi:hypothetical protein
MATPFRGGPRDPAGKSGSNDRQPLVWNILAACSLISRRLGYGGDSGNRRRGDGVTYFLAGNCNSRVQEARKVDRGRDMGHKKRGTSSGALIFLLSLLQSVCFFWLSSFS